MGWRRWRDVLAAVVFAVGATACAPDVDTDAAAAGSHATIAQIAETLGRQPDVVCANGRMGTAFMDVGLPTRLSLRIYVEDVGPERMVELVREAAQQAWESDVRITSRAIQAVDRFEDRHTTTDDIVVTLKHAYPELADLDGEYSFDREELEPILGPRSPHLAAVIGRERPTGQICPLSA